MAAPTWLLAVDIVGEYLPLQLMKAAVPTESYMLSIIYNRHLYSPAMSTASNQVGAALFPSITIISVLLLRMLWG